MMFGRFQHVRCSMFYFILFRQKSKKRNSKSGIAKNNSPDAPIIPPEVPPGVAYTVTTSPLESHADGTYGKSDPTTAKSMTIRNKSPQNLGNFDLILNHVVQC